MSELPPCDFHPCACVHIAIVNIASIRTSRGTNSFACDDWSPTYRQWRGTCHIESCQWERWTGSYFMLCTFFLTVFPLSVHIFCETCSCRFCHGCRGCCYLDSIFSCFLFTGGSEQYISLHARECCGNCKNCQLIRWYLTHQFICQSQTDASFLLFVRQHYSRIISKYMQPVLIVKTMMLVWMRWERWYFNVRNRTILFVLFNSAS